VDDKVIFGIAIGTLLPPDWLMIGIGLFLIGVLTWTDAEDCIYNKKYGKKKAIFMRGVMGVILGNIAMSLTIPLWEHISKTQEVPITFKASTGLFVAFFQSSFIQFIHNKFNIEKKEKN